MAEKETETGPSLELPSLFGRRKRRAEQSGDEQPGDTATLPSVDEPAAPDETTRPAGHETGHETDDARHAPTETSPAVEPDPTPPTAHTPAVTPTPVPTPPPAEPQSPPARRTPEPAATPPVAPTGAEGAPAEAGRRSGGRRRAEGGRQVPEMAASSAAFLVGAAVGLAGCVLTYLGLMGCELVTGTDSCGGPGLLVLIVILVLMVLLGAAALRALRVPDPGNVSFLGVGVLTVVALVFLADYLYDAWMFVVVPAVTAVSFALARWITTLYAEDVLGDDDDGMPHHDIR